MPAFDPSARRRCIMPISPVLGRTPAQDHRRKGHFGILKGLPWRKKGPSGGLVGAELMAAEGDEYDFLSEDEDHGDHHGGARREEYVRGSAASQHQHRGGRGEDRRSGYRGRGGDDESGMSSDSSGSEGSDDDAEVFAEDESEEDDHSSSDEEVRRFCLQWSCDSSCSLTPHPPPTSSRGPNLLSLRVCAWTRVARASGPRRRRPSPCRLTAA